MRDEMADFKQAVIWMKESKKVRRSGGNIIYSNPQGNRLLYYKHPCNSTDYSGCIIDFEATDWEIYEEKDNWNLANAFKSGIGTMTENTRTFIQNVKEDVDRLDEVLTIKNINKIIDKRAGNL